MITPRPYQAEALEALDKHLRTKDTNPCVVLPTGSGKSNCIGWSIKNWKRNCPSFRCIVLAHRKELVLQNVQEFCRFCHQDDLDLHQKVGVFSAGLKRKDYDASILFASIDSVYRRSGDFEPFDAIMVDEAHRIPHRGEGKYLTFLKGCQRFNSKLRIVGWTATPYRMSTGLICHKDHLLNEVCYEANVVDLIEQGYLCRLRTKLGHALPDLKEVKKRYGEYVTSQLSVAVTQKRLIADAVSEAVRIIKAEGRRHIMVFCVDVAHCNIVSAVLNKHGIFAPAVTNKTRAETRDRIGEDFKSGKLSAVCNVNVYTEGFNATSIDCIVLLRPTLSPGLFYQMVGRGLRNDVEKLDCLVLDFARCVQEHGPIDLLGTNQKVVLATCEECREVFSRAIDKCPQCGWEIPKREIERMEAEERKRQMHDRKPSDAAILSGFPNTYPVDDVSISRHCKDGKPDSLLVRYRSKLEFFREWICLDHPGYAGQKAQQWWAKRFGDGRKVTVNETLESLFTVPTLREWTQTITVKRKGKYYEIVDYNRPLLEKEE